MMVEMNILYDHIMIGSDRMKCIKCNEKTFEDENVCRKHLDVRLNVQKKSMDIGHCICTPKLSLGGKPCPCNAFTKWNICHCAGEDKGDVPEGYKW